MVLAKNRAGPHMKSAVLGDVVVLLLDDDPLIRDGLAAELPNYGFQVFTATNVTSAIRQQTLHCPHVILFDVTLFAAKGLDVWRVLRAMGRNTRSVMYCRSATAIDGFEAHKLGVDVVLLKPARLDEIVEALRKAVFGSVATDPVADFCREICASGDDTAAELLLSRVVDLLADVRVELMEFGRVADICKRLTAPDTEPEEAGAIRRGLTDVVEGRRRIGPHVRDLIRVIANSAETSDESHDWPFDVRSELHSTTGRWPHSWHRIARLRRAVHELVRTREQVAQIAVHLGFLCGGRLCHDLHELTGLSPTQLRNLHSERQRK